MSKFTPGNKPTGPKSPTTIGANRTTAPKPPVKGVAPTGPRPTTAPTIGAKRAPGVPNSLGAPQRSTQSLDKAKKVLGVGKPTGPDPKTKVNQRIDAINQILPGVTFKKR